LQPDLWTSPRAADSLLAEIIQSTPVPVIDVPK